MNSGVNLRPRGSTPSTSRCPSANSPNAVKKGGTNVLLTLKIDGQDELAIPKAIQRDPIKGIYRHVDLLTVRRGEKITVDGSGCSSSARSCGVACSRRST